MIDVGFNVNAIESETYDTPLHYAVYSRKFDTIKLLLSKGADTALINRYSHKSPISAAMALRDGHLIELLFTVGTKHGCTQPGRDWVICPVLIIAVLHGSVDEVSRLIAAREDVNGRSKGGYTAMHMASFFGHTEVMARLFDAGADSAVCSDWSYSPLHFAAQQADHALCRCILERAKPSLDRLNLRDGNGHTVLYLAVRNASIESVRALLAAGCDPTVLDNDLSSLIHLCVIRNSEEIMALLLNGGAPVDLKNKRGWTPLGTSVILDRLNLARMLLSAGADLFDLGPAPMFTVCKLIRRTDANNRDDGLRGLLREQLEVEQANMAALHDGTAPLAVQERMRLRAIHNEAAFMFSLETGAAATCLPMEFSNALAKARAHGLQTAERRAAMTEASTIRAHMANAWVSVSQAASTFSNTRMAAAGQSYAVDKAIVKAAKRMLDIEIALKL